LQQRGPKQALQSLNYDSEGEGGEGEEEERTGGAIASPCGVSRPSRGVARFQPRGEGRLQRGEEPAVAVKEVPVCFNKGRKMGREGADRERRERCGSTEELPSW